EALTEKIWTWQPSHIHAQLRAQYERLSVYQLKKYHLILVDEAGMVGTPTWQALMTRVEAVGAKLIAVGDDHQFKAIEAGDAFRKLVESAKTKNRLSQLSQIHRQRHE